MYIEEIQQICGQLPGVTQDIKWDDHLCFNVGGKMFLVTTPDSVPHTVSFKVPDEEFETFCSREGIIPAPYLARYKWVHLDDINRLSHQEWENCIRQSYQLVVAKLPAKTRKQVEQDQKT